METLPTPPTTPLPTHGRCSSADIPLLLMNFPTDPDSPCILPPLILTKKILTRTTLLIFLTDLPPKLPKRSQSTPQWKKPRMEARKLLTYLYELVETATHDQYQLEMLMTSANSFLEKRHLPVSLRLGLVESLLDTMIRITMQMALITLWLVSPPRTPPVKISVIKSLLLSPRSGNASPLSA